MGPGRRAAVLVALAAVGCALVLLLPVLAAPVAADDRYWYLSIPLQTGNSYLGVFRVGWEELPQAVATGRVAPLGSVARRLVALASMQLALATGTSVIWYLAAVKLLLSGACVLAALLLVRTLRVRAADGRIRRAGTPVLWLVGVVGTVLFAAGAQAQGQFRNAWTAYPVLTYGCFVVVCGTAALTLALTGAVARRPTLRRRLVVGLVMLLVAGLLCLSYELVYAAVPVAALALLLQAVDAPGDRRAAVVAKLVTGVPLVGGFLVGAVAVRLYSSSLCADTGCYVGVEPQVGGGAARTAAYNLASSLPLWTGTYRQDLDAVGWGSRWPVGPSAWSVATGLLAAGVVLAAGRLTAPRLRRLAAQASAQRRLLVHAACLLAVAAITPAAIMAISVQAQQVITEPGVPYRNTVMTWAGAAFALACAAAAAAIAPRRGPGRAGWVVLGAVAAGVAVLGAVSLPRNLAALAATRARPGVAVVEDVHEEVVRERTDAASVARRCATRDRLLATRPGGYLRIAEGADTLYATWFGVPFCPRPRP